MNSARNQFILVGMLCQGLAWDTPLYWIFAIVLWALALGPLRKRVEMNANLELTALVAGSALSLLAARFFSQSSHFFLGDGIVCLQAARMMRPLSRREKLASVLMACFHVAVACTLAPDARFLLLALGTLVLLPKSLVELQSEDFERVDSRLEWSVLIPLTLIAIAMFVSVPRFAVGTPLQMGSSAVGAGGLLSSVLDPSSGGYANSAQVLLQIEGKNLGYLKCMALSQFDGEKWLPDENVALRQIRRVPEEELQNYPHRRVRVKQVGFLGRILPADGDAVGLKGKFFDKPLLNSQGVIECMSTRNTANNQYEYWIDPNPPAEPMSAVGIRYHTAHPGASERLNQWLGQVTAGATNQFEVARRLEARLRRDLNYRIGAPALNRLNSLEDFLFDKQEGHCERFASALALLLRMYNIPTRIAIGYVPGPQSRLSDWRQVRFKDAHAWTEAWFPDKGWVSFDATPGGGGGEDTHFGVTELLESLDLVWYSHVVSFDGATQREILAHSMNGMLAMKSFAARNPILLVGFVAAAFAPWIYRRKGKLRRGERKPLKRAEVSRADHYYAGMLRALARRGVVKAPEQTPLEFLEQLREAQARNSAEVETITRAFCKSHYGEIELGREEAERVRSALRAIESRN